MANSDAAFQGISYPLAWLSIPRCICQLLSMVIWNVKPQNPIPRQEFFVSRGLVFYRCLFASFYFLFARLGVAVSSTDLRIQQWVRCAREVGKTLCCFPHFIDLPSCLQVHLDNQLIGCTVPWCNRGAKPVGCPTWFMISHDRRTRSAHISNASVFAQQCH